MVCSGDTLLLLAIATFSVSQSHGRLVANVVGIPQELNCKDKCTTPVCGATCDALSKQYPCGQNYCPTCKWAGWCDKTCGFCPSTAIPGVCAGRSDSCSVLLDVPDKCAGEASKCPVAFFFHGHGGRNTEFIAPAAAHNGGASSLVHEYGYIGVYPQGETYGNSGSGWNDGSMAGNKCKWNDFSCQDDPNDGNFTRDIIKTLRSLGSTGRVYLWGGSNGANSAQIFAANAGEDLPIAGISAGWGQLLSAPPRSGPAPFDWNQPSKNTTGRPGDGRMVAQQAHHGDADTVIPYQGGPRFDSDIWILMPEPQSDKTWAKHNGCTGELSNQTGIPASYMNRQSGQETKTTAIKYTWNDCPPKAPVEYYRVIGAPHGGASSINGRSPFYIVFDFWQRVEKAYEEEETAAEAN